MMANIDRDVAEYVVAIASKCREDLANIIPILKSHSDKDFYDDVGFNISTIIYEIEKEVIEKILECNDDMKVIYRRRIDKIGHGF